MFKRVLFVLCSIVTPFFPIQFFELIKTTEKITKYNTQGAKSKIPPLADPYYVLLYHDFASHSCLTLISFSFIISTSATCLSFLARNEN